MLICYSELPCFSSFLQFYFNYCFLYSCNIDVIQIFDFYCCVFFFWLFFWSIYRITVFSIFFILFFLFINLFVCFYCMILLFISKLQFAFIYSKFLFLIFLFNNHHHTRSDLKNQMKSYDSNFFEELEDLKFRYSQLQVLNIFFLFFSLFLLKWFIYEKKIIYWFIYSIKRHL